MTLYELYAVDGSTHFVMGVPQDCRNDIITFNNGMEFRLDNIIYVKKVAIFASVEECQQNIDRIQVESGLTKVFVHGPKEVPRVR